MSPARPIVLLLHGPNLNLLGEREPEVYGTATLADYIATARAVADGHGLEIDAVQSNHEGDLVDAIHAARTRCAAIIVNAGALTHYAWSLHDALAAFDGAIVEVHISDPKAREAWRHVSVIEPVAHASIVGRGMRGYEEAVDTVAKLIGDAVVSVLAEMPPIGYSIRPDALRARLDGRTMIVSNPVSVRWLTGFGGTLGWVVVGPEHLVLVTDGRYADRAAAELAAAGVDAEIVVERTRPAIRDAVVAAARDGERVVAEAGHLTHAAWLDFTAELELEPAGDPIEALRRVKDGGEIARIEHAASIADAALADVAPTLADRPTEVDVHDELEYRMRRLGADGPSYDTIVASGPEHAARPHHVVARRSIEEGDTVIIDVGALVDGYHSDMTRTFVVGEPSAEQQRIYDLVLDVQAAGLAAVAPGVAAAAVDAVCRARFAAAGFDEWFLHGTGHGVGLLIHEDPFATSTSTAELVEGDVVTVEPGLYRGGFGGVRIEDLVVVTPGGCRRLTHTPKDAPCLPSRPTS